MSEMPRFTLGRSAEAEITFQDLIAVVSDVARNDREVVAVVLHMLGSGKIRLRGDDSALRPV